MVDPLHADILDKVTHYFPLLLLIFLLPACSSTTGKACKQNLKGEYIYRRHNEFFFTPPSPRPQTRENYPWESRYIHGLPRISKDFFRCKGDLLHPVVVQEREGRESIKYYDCAGAKSHGLPLKEGKEFVYPCLIELLNHIQEKTGKKVVITCGHRCPKHNAYSDPSGHQWNSKHMIGAEVDFYVEGLEARPLDIVSLLHSYYQEHPQWKNSTEYTCFQRYDHESVHVITPPWYNKEIFIKLYLENEGRDSDNQHKYPYISIQVRHDRDLDTKVSFDPKAAQNYLRH